MSNATQKISQFNRWGSGYYGDDQTSLDTVTDLALDPVNLAEYGATIDLPFVRAAEQTM